MSRRNSVNLSSDERTLIDFYIELYNRNNREIDRLRDNQQEIMQDIRALTNMPTQPNRNNNNNRRGNNNQRNPSPNPTQTPRPARRQTYYDAMTGIYYIDGRPYRLDFISNYVNNAANTIWNTFDPVTVRPSAQTIRDSTRTIEYSQVETPLNTTCPISLEPFAGEDQVTQIIGCGHLFNGDSLNVWFQRNVRCPVCRYDVRTIIRNHSFQRDNSNPIVNEIPVNNDQSILDEDPIEDEMMEQNEVPHNGVPQNGVPQNGVPENEMTGNETSDRDITQSLTNLTETILTRLLNPSITSSGRNSFLINNTNTRIMYDPSNNEVTFQGFY
jgi:hypothetical protein